MLIFVFRVTEIRATLGHRVCTGNTRTYFQIGFKFSQFSRDSCVSLQA